jgi:alcohol dehydrogenase
MKAWKVTAGAKRELVELAAPVNVARGGVVVRMQAAPVLSYLRDVLDGKLPYVMPAGPFTPGSHGVGVVERVGAGVYHLAEGERVLVDPHVVVDERVPEPAQILIGLTAMGAARGAAIPEAALALQRDWSDGTFAELVHVPASVVTRVPAELREERAVVLAALSKFAVPYGGLLRAGLLPGETVFINGATGYFGSAAALLALTLGAARVVAAGRDRAALDALRSAADARLVPVVLSGDVEADTRALRAAAGGAGDLALDMVGGAKDSRATSAVLRALRRRGRLVLMGSVAAPLELNVGEMLANEWHVLGNFMYPPEAPARLAALAASRQLDLSRLTMKEFELAGLEAALEAATRMRGLDFIALTMGAS